jgi:release factor glutamine methyltransferase
VNGTPVPQSPSAEPPPAGEPWTVLRLIRWSAAYLEEKGVERARLDAEHLLAHTLEMGRLDLYLHFDRPLSSEELDAFKPRLLDRARRKPLQYILERTSFRELDLRTDPRVLIPRPETEELVEAVLARVREWGREGLRALDVGTGSGAIALSLALEGPFEKVVATDNAPEALELARLNAADADLASRVEFREGHLLEPVATGERFHVLVSNPPYVTEEEFRELDPEVREWEPRRALVAAEGGKAILAALVAGGTEVLEPGGLLALEVGLGQAGAVARRIRETPEYGAPLILKDLSGRERMILAERA